VVACAAVVALVAGSPSGPVDHVSSHTTRGLAVREGPEQAFRRATEFENRYPEKVEEAFHLYLDAEVKAGDSPLAAEIEERMLGARGRLRQAMKESEIRLRETVKGFLREGDPRKALKAIDQANAAYGSEEWKQICKSLLGQIESKLP
jgi:hypothetical protein